MGHARHVRDNRLALDIFTKRNREPRFGLYKGFGFHQLFETDFVAFLIGHLDADITGAGDRRFDAHVGGGERQRQIIRQPGDLADLYLDPLAFALNGALDIARFDQILGNRWPFVGPFKIGRYTKKGQCLLDQAPLLADQIITIAAPFPVAQHILDAR